MQSDEYVTSANASRILGVHPNTLRKWDGAGIIECLRVSNGNRLYNISKFKRDKKRGAEPSKEETKDRIDVIYCRVSSPKQREDLQRQTKMLETSYPGFQVFSDTGSGINFKRKGLKRLLQEVMRGRVRKVVVSYRDRLCRIAFDLLEWICHEHQTQLLVHNKDQEGSDEKELLEDLMAITHVFSSRLYGKRSNQSRQSGKISAKNVLVMKLLLVQLRILAVREELNRQVSAVVVQSVQERIEKLQEYEHATGKLSKTQRTQLETLVSALDKFRNGCYNGEESIPDLLQRQDSLTSELAKRLFTLDPHVKRAKRVRVVHIEPKSKSTLREYMRVSRKIFNKALDLHNKGTRGEELRKRCVRSAYLQADLRKVLEHVRQKAFDKYKSSQASCDSLEGHLAFISRKKDEQWVGLQKRDCRIEGGKLTLFGKVELKLNETLADGEPECDVEITESHGIFYATFMNIRKYNTPQKADISTARVCALGMGERTFGTLYDPDGTIAFLGTDANQRVKARLRVIYKLRNGLKTKLQQWKRRRILKGVRRASAKLKNLIKEMHHSIATWLVSNYDVVLIGKLGVGVMKCKRKGKRVLQTLSHYSFRRTLLQKASLYQRSVRVVSEAYTTKQCNRCG